MTSVNTRPAPYTVGYEQPQKASPINYEDSAQAAQEHGAQANSAPPNRQMTPAQRGNFSSHRSIVNPNQAQGAGAPDPLAELTEKNNALHAKLKALTDKFGPIIKQLSQKIMDLTAQLETSGKATNDASNAQAQGRGSDRQNVAPPETSPNQDDVSTQQSADTQQPAPAPGTPDAPVTQPGQAAGLDELIQATAAFSKTLDSILERFKAIIEGLTQTINDLMTRIDTMNTSQNQAPSEQADGAESASPYSAQPETQASSQNERSAQVNAQTAPANGDVEGIKKENARLEAQLDYMEDMFADTISRLQQQVATLAQKIPQKG
ncbi:hypothetical protein ACMSI6_07240 [Pseudomonas antarctica]|uniref:hypothetical protein n=1 Tax=Pseudomonas antarctica TaxID=219572 RepID=UPI0039C211D1